LVRKILVLLAAAAVFFAALPGIVEAEVKSDADKLRDFLAMEHEEDTNASLLGWDIDDTSTWRGAEWKGDRLKKLTLTPSGASLFGTLGLAGCTELETFICTANSLVYIDVSGCTALRDFQCGNNQLFMLDVTGCTALETLSCQENFLASLSLADCSALKKLEVQYNVLTELDLTLCPGITELYCQYNRLTSLDVSACYGLTNAMAHKNPFQDTEGFVQGLPEEIQEYSFSQADESLHVTKNAEKTVTVKSAGGGFAKAILNLPAMQIDLITNPTGEEGRQFQHWADAIGMTQPQGDNKGMYKADITADTASVTAVFSDEGATLPGDANCDDKVNIDDILFCRDVIFGTQTPTQQGLVNINCETASQVSIQTILFIRDIIFA